MGLKYNFYTGVSSDIAAALFENTENPYYDTIMYTIIETPTFKKQVDQIWSEDERLEFVQWLAVNPDAGDVIPHAEGARKVRWGLKGTGKRGGVRIIYFNKTEEGSIYLIAIYRKTEKENMPAHEIKRSLPDES